VATEDNLGMLSKYTSTYIIVALYAAELIELFGPFAKGDKFSLGKLSELVKCHLYVFLTVEVVNFTQFQHLLVGHNAFQSLLRHALCEFGSLLLQTWQT
jgi:hypothetical protein